MSVQSPRICTYAIRRCSPRPFAPKPVASREVGVRLALGAEPSQLLGMIVMQAATLAAIGVAIGLIVDLPLAPLLDSQL